MKYIIRFVRDVIICGFVLAIGMNTQAAQSNEPESRDVAIQVGEVFIPSGFDSSSDAYVIISGMFPNGCYKWKEAMVRDTSPTEHEIKSIATVSSGICLMVLVPFSKEIQLGKLSSGEHILRFISDDGTYLEKVMKIE